MRSHRDIAMVAALVLGLVAPGSALAENPNTLRAVQAVDQAATGLANAEQNLAQASASSRALGKKIGVLKKRNQLGGQLQEALRESQRVEAQVERATKAVHQAESTLNQRSAKAIALIDAEIREKKPGLKKGSRTQRAKVAAELQSLYDLRKRVSAQALRSSRASKPRADLYEYDVEVDPLDGPEEIEQKKDFIEDSRDKVKKKLHQLRARLEEAKQEQSVHRAARNFRRQVDMFDENVVTGVVSRSSPQQLGTTSADKRTDQGTAETTGGTGGSANPAPSSGANERSNTTDDTTSNFDGAPQGAAAPPAESPDTTADPGAQTPADPDTGGYQAPPPAAEPSNNPVTPPVTATPHTPNYSGSNPLQPSRSVQRLTLDERLQQLDPSSANLKSIEAQLKELERIDTLLKKRARELEKRAKKLRQDEARELRVK